MEGYGSKHWSRCRELLSIDRRSLALFRVGLGLMLFCDTLKRCLTLREHYTGEGVFPGSVAGELEPDFWLFRVFLLSDRLEVQAVLFAVMALLALCVMVGYRTKLASMAAFVFLVAVIRRNPYCCHTGDIWLEVLAFWAMFLPLGACFSFDRWRGRAPTLSGNAVFSMGTAALLVQIALFYFMAGYLKHGYDIWIEGEALRVFTGISEYTRPFGSALGDYPGLCRFLTYFTLVLELGAPILFFVPFYNAQLRLLLIVLLSGFHLAIQMSVYIGIFEILSILALSVLLPPLFWDSILPRLPILGRLGERWGRVPVPSSEAQPLPRVARLGGEALAAFALVIVLVSNVNTARSEDIPLPRKLDDYARQIGLIQNWNVFTDIDSLFFGWYLVLGQTRDGRLVNVLEGTEHTEIRVPEHPARAFTNHNQRRFWGQAARPGQEWLRVHLARHLYLRWEREHGEPLSRMAIYHIATTPGGERPRMRVRRLHLQEFPRPDLRDALPYEVQRAALIRKQWRQALAQVPAFVVP